MYAAAIGRTDYAHLVVWRRVYPDKPIPKGWTAAHLCGVTLCQRPALLERVTRAENTRRRHHRPPVEYGSTHIPSTSRTFAIALFAAIHRPSIDARSLSLDELIDLLSAFQVLEDKHRGRCRSPTRYADGARQCRRARGERAGVRSGPGPAHFARLAGICWLDHTTWSHRPEAPRWRVVIPVARPVPAQPTPRFRSAAGPLPTPP